MTRLSLRARLALMSGALVVLVGTLVAFGGYLALRDSLLGQAKAQARDQARQLAALVDVAGSGGEQQGNLVDIGDPTLSHAFARSGLLVRIVRPDGKTVQAGRGGGALSAAPSFLARCTAAGGAETRRGGRAPVALSCRRIGTVAKPAGMVLVGAPLRNAYASLSRLRGALGIGLGAGMLLAALAAYLVASRALRPARRIADTAQSIRGGDIGRRIDWRGANDELGALAQVLDECFEELEQAVDRQRRFVADASHELKTPIAAMRAQIDVLRNWAAEEPKAREAVIGSLDRAAHRAGRLVADLLYLSELDRSPPIARLPVALDEVLLSVVQEARPLRQEVGIRVTQLDETEVTGDAHRLQQLLLNLLDNALRASPPDGEIRLGLEHTGVGAARITVGDEGPGIAPDRLERIFDRFYSASAGTGLGLAIAREIARAHGGDLTARNDTRGAVFELTLPASPNPHPHLIGTSSDARSLPGATTQSTGGD